MKGLNRQTEFGGFSSGQLIYFPLNFSDFVIQYENLFLASLVFIKKRLALSEVLLALLDVESQFILQGGIAGLQEHGVRNVNGVAYLLGFLSDMAFFG